MQRFVTTIVNMCSRIFSLYFFILTPFRLVKRGDGQLHIRVVVVLMRPLCRVINIHVTSPPIICMCEYQIIINYGSPQLFLLALDIYRYYTIIIGTHRIE